MSIFLLGILTGSVNEKRRLIDELARSVVNDLARVV